MGKFSNHRGYWSPLKPASIKMGKFAFLVVALCLAQYTSAGNSPGWMSISEASRKPEDTVCKFDLHIEETWTMMLREEMFWTPVSAEEDGYHMKVPPTCSNEEHMGPPLTPEQTERIIPADGEYERVLSINGSVPGPALVVYYGQHLEITFHNDLVNEATTVHMHGFLERNNPYMDGVAGLSQCPINPTEKFTYKVFAEPAGTFWYHAHLGDQFGMGIQGALIVRDRPEDLAEKRGEDPLPEFKDEFLSMFQDWGSGTGEAAYLTASFIHKFSPFSYGPEEEECYELTKNAAGIETSDNDFHSATVNGMGWVLDHDGNPKNENLPLEVYVVEEGGAYRFRLISASVIFSFMVSIDHHTLNVIAMDGHDVKAYKADYVVLFPGDRFDFYIDATDPLGTGLYWMRFETLETSDENNNRVDFHHKVNAIVRYTSTCDGVCDISYKGAQEQPKSTKKECTEAAPCPAINCPFKAWPQDHIECVHPSELKSTMPVTENWEFTEDTYSEIFLNIGFWNITGKGFQPGVNGKVLAVGPEPAQVFKDGDLSKSVIPCDCPEVGVQGCPCTYVIPIKLGNVVDLVITAMAETKVRFGNTHPMHMHGYAPQVIGVGWPQYNDTGITNQGTMDIHETNHRYTQWADETWKNGKNPYLKGPDAARKDTINAILGGYVVWRFKADNPGFWILHCHTEYHATAGMGFVFQVGDVSDMADTPERMKRCGDFAPTEEEFKKNIDGINHDIFQ